MVTVDYSEVLEGVCDLIGIGSGEILTVDANRIRRLLNKRLRVAWEWRFWPDTVLVQQRWFRDLYDASDTYAQGAEVFDVLTGKYWIRADSSVTAFVPGAGNEWVEARKSYSGEDWVTGTVYAAGTTVRYPVNDSYYFCWKTTTGAEAPTTTARFVRLTPFEAYIDLEQTGLDEIGLVRACWDKNPRLFKNALEAHWFRGPDKIVVLDDVTSVWVEFQSPSPQLLGSAYSATAAYTPGDYIYFASNFYVCVTTTTAGQSPVTHAAKWEIQGIPVEFQRYLEQGAYADWLPSDGQNDRRRFEAALAEQYLAEVTVRLLGLQSQNNQTRVQTR
jgi:hypothetical protein